MRLLLDTHIWLWSLLEPAKLSQRVASELESAENELWLSPISIWELLILVEKGRVVLDRPPATWIAEVREAVPFQEARGMQVLRGLGGCDRKYARMADGPLSGL